jgi:hypothetical protein
MDQRVTNVCLIFENLFLAIDTAVWMNFSVRQRGCEPLYVISGPSNDYAVVSDDVLELFELPITHPLFGDYIPMDYDHIEIIATDPKAPKHWEDIRGMFSGMDGEILRYIIQMDIPLEKFIRYELASRGYDKDHKWCGFDKAREIWLSDEH